MKCTILKEDQKHRILRIVLRAVLVGLFLFIIAGVAWFSYSKSRIGRIDHAFSEVNSGDHASRVTELLGSPHGVLRGSEMTFLSLLPEDKRDQCTKQYRYAEETFFMPILWLVFFDDHERVIMKCRLD